MLDKRNELTHDYDGTMAKEAFSAILNEYIPLLEDFKEKVGALLQDEDAAT